MATKNIKEMSFSELNKQLEKLQNELEHRKEDAVSNFKYYRDILIEMNIDPNSISSDLIVSNQMDIIPIDEMETVSEISEERIGLDITNDRLTPNPITALYQKSPELLNILLRDNTLSTDTEQVNVFWANDNYQSRGVGFQYDDKITTVSLMDDSGDVVISRVKKSKLLQNKRCKDKAEAFTPTWICNSMNNSADSHWVLNGFNTMSGDMITWETRKEKITFLEGKTWKDYIFSQCLEMTCGEAPFIVSRYDAVTGEYIPVENRIGQLDRKLRVVSENTDTEDEWIEWAINAYKSIYGYEWQGDSLLLARINLLYTFIENYYVRFGTTPKLSILFEIANIISWNIWQMDGLKEVIPNSCSSSCKGCKIKDDLESLTQHDGIYCKIMDWGNEEVIPFYTLNKIPE